MINTTTPKDLAEKIEWVGFRNLSRSEKQQVGEALDDVSRHLPRLLALALWKFFGQSAPQGLETLPTSSSMDSFQRRDKARRYIKEIMKDFREEDCGMH